MAFNIDAAKKEGYTDKEIIEYLSKSRKFNLESARKEGYSDAEILDYFKRQEATVRVPAAVDPATAMMVGRGTGVQPETLAIPPREQVPGRFEQGKEFLGKAITEFPADVVRTGKELIKGIGEIAKHPVQTMQGLQNLAIGQMGRSILGDQPELQGPAAQQQALAQNVEQSLRQLGTQEGLTKQITERPAESMLYLSMLMGGAGAGARGAGLTRTGQVLTKAGQAVDPFVLTGRAALGVGRFGRSAVEHATGILTGKSAATMKKIRTGGRRLTEQMRGKTSGKEIVEHVKESQGVTKSEMGANYVDDLARLKQSPIDEISIAPVESRLDKMIKDFRVRITEEGTLDFSSSVLDPGSQAARDFQRINDIVRTWRETPGNLTPIGLDTLKRRLDWFYTDHSEIRAVTTALRNQVKDILVKTVPEYASMTAHYEKTSEFLKQAKKALSSGDKASIDTTLKKLLTSFKEDAAYRRSVIQELNVKTGVDIEAEIAGYLLRDPLPSGLFGRQVEAGLVFGIMAGWKPEVAAMMLAASPRVAGEFLNGVAQMVNAAERTKKILDQVGVTRPVLRQAPLPIQRLREEQEQIQGTPRLGEFLSPQTGR